MRRTLVIWSLTIVVTLASVVYQRVTGPTHTVRGSIQISERTIKYKLLRSHDSTSDAEMEIPAPAAEIQGKMRWRRYKSNDSWITEKLKRRGEKLVMAIPKQPPAGKILYQVTLIDGNGNEYNLTQKPVVIRFKGAVPKSVLVPHIIFMFAAMLVATRAGLEAIVKGANAYRFAIWTSFLLFLGGLVFGPMVQKYAFGSFWTGWPFGHDLTDTKIAVTMLFWIIALWRGRNPQKGRAWIITAALITLLVYLIPHSSYGSELDYKQMS